jgi:type IV pilus assembly protein PilQ
VTDIPSKLEEVQQLIAKIDIPVRQVLIEARIVEASDTFGKSLGVKLGGSPTCAGSRAAMPAIDRAGNRVAFGGSYNAVASSGARWNSRLQGKLREPAGDRPNGYNPATFAVSMFSSAANRFLNLELSALEADGKGKVVSSPRVVTADQIKALIEQGTELPYQVATSSGATSIAFRKANLKLEVTPQITPEGNIIWTWTSTRTPWVRRRGGFCHQHQAHQDPGAGGKRRHGGDRRHLRTDRDRERDQGAIAGRPARRWQPVQDPLQNR